MTSDVMNPIIDSDAMQKETDYRKKGTQLNKDLNASGNDLASFRKLSTDDQQAVTDARQRETDRQTILAKLAPSDYQRKAYNNELDQTGGVFW
jgi:predicted  nucleic acid-binding Zn-ribbon protein